MKSKKGFTLVEMLVVVLIIGILAAIAVPQYQFAVAKSRAAEALSVIKSLRPAIDEYILANGSFPKTFNDLSLIPSGAESKYSIQGDKMIGQYYSFILVNCRLDVDPLNEDSYEPAFLYEGCENQNLQKLKPSEIYCYYSIKDTNATKRDAICKQLTNSEIDSYSTNGRMYKM